ncbi:MAG: hypothetical protein ACR2JE_05475, partial [Acidobacteriaceae bacterium]
MSDSPNNAAIDPVDAAPTTSRGTGAEGARPTALAEALSTHVSTLELDQYRGGYTPGAFSGRECELHALLGGTGIFDRGYRARIEVRGEDRSRWLNGMLTNNVQDLALGEGNYNFVLNAQGRIQGDCQTFRLADRLLLETDRNQVPALLAHLDHFIIMDDVE